MGSAGWWWRRSGGTVGYLPGMERTHTHHKEMQMHDERLQRGSRVRTSVALWDGGEGTYICAMQVSSVHCPLRRQPRAAAAAICRQKTS